MGSTEIADEVRIDPHDNEDLYDKYIGAEIILDSSNPETIATRSKATVLRRARDDDGKPIGKADNNPLLDSRAYDVELEDGTIERYFANIIAENLWSQCDDKERQFHVAHTASLIIERTAKHYPKMTDM